MWIQRASEICRVDTAKSSPDEWHVDDLRNPDPTSAVHLTTTVSEESPAGARYSHRKAGYLRLCNRTQVCRRTHSSFVSKAQPLTTLLQRLRGDVGQQALAELCRMVCCRAATSELSVKPIVPVGDMDIPLITGLMNTVEWLTDYNNFYEKRCALLHNVSTTHFAASLTLMLTSLHLLAYGACCNTSDLCADSQNLDPCSRPMCCSIQWWW